VPPSAASRSDATPSAGPPDAQGWVACTLPIESVDDGVREVLRLGPDAEVLGPPALRAAMVEALAQIGARYS